MGARDGFWREALSPGLVVLLVLAVASSLVVLRRPPTPREGAPFWIFARDHYTTYAPFVERWNATRPDYPVDLQLLQFQVLERRMLSAFLSGTPVADLIEVERAVAGRAFTGPLDRVGFLDLTDRLAEAGLLTGINEPSFSPWTSRGRIFGLPHDVHPVLLAYRADLVAAAGLNVDGIETWDDFITRLRPLVQDLDGDGRPDRYLLNVWPTLAGPIEALVMQAGGRLFDDDGQPALAAEPNPTTLATLVSWMVGPNRIAGNAPEFSASGHRLRLEGHVVACILPDWMVGQWKREIPGLAGRWRLMPLPAWTPGGRRTSVYGGTMLAITRTTSNPDGAWAFAQALYTDAAGAELTFRGTGIIPPVKALWNLPVFDEPDPYFGGQPIGRLFIDQAPNVPHRSSSPFGPAATARLMTALQQLVREAESSGRHDATSLREPARRLLAEGDRQLAREIGRNVFLAVEAEAGGGGG